MNEEEFAKLTLEKKWEHLAEVMDYIIHTDKMYDGANIAHSLRRRLNPHHSKDQVEQETQFLKDEQRKRRLNQYQRWSHAKNLYAAHRDEMANTLENDKYSEYLRILEKVFTAEFDEALRSVISDE